MVIEERCDSSSNGSSGMRTYKRRKCGGSSSSNGKLVEPSTRFEDKMVKEFVDIDLQKSSCEQICDPKINCHSLLNGSDDCSDQHWRDVLENLYQSFNPSEGEANGIQGCIRDALNNSRSNDESLSKDRVDHYDDQSRLQKIWKINGCSSDAQGLAALGSNGSLSESDQPTVSRICERAFFKLVMSGKFASLCKLLSENFLGLKIEKILDFNLINTRMKEGAYERSPMLFSSDIQQIWKRLHSIGNEMVSLANNLSEVSRAFCHQLGVGAELDSSSGRKHEQFSVRDLDMHIKTEEPGASVSCSCRQCGEKSDGRDCLVCDSCEEIFHVSCIQPAVKEIPHRSWYCANCTASGVESPHEDCAVCERLKAKLGMNGGAEMVPTYEDEFDEFEESSDGIIETGPQVFSGSKRLPCKVCGHTLSNGEEFLICEHRFCQYKYYHTRCLTDKQLKSYGPRWYCPSCLCRACLTDKDDDDLVMCDGCDHGYHIYCMNPPRTSIPKGKWFCLKCDAGIRAIREAKKLYEGLEKKKKTEGKRATDGSANKRGLDFEEAVGGSGGMDMLLTAARTLSEEELATLDRKS